MVSMHTVMTGHTIPKLQAAKIKPLATYCYARYQRHYKLLKRNEKNIFAPIHHRSHGKPRRRANVSFCRTTHDDSSIPATQVRKCRAIGPRFLRLHLTGAPAHDNRPAPQRLATGKAPSPIRNISWAVTPHHRHFIPAPKGPIWVHQNNAPHRRSAQGPRQ